MFKFTLYLWLIFAALPVSADNFGKVPEFSFQDINKQTVSNTSLAGKTYLINFFFSSCPHICPVINGKVATLAAANKDNKDLHFLSISVDPKRDTFKVLKNYSERFQADPAKWHFVRGNKDIVNQFTEKLMLPVSHIPDRHTTRIVLVNSKGDVEGYFKGLDTEDFKKLSELLSKIQ